MKIIGKRRKYSLWDTFPSSVDIMMVDRKGNAGAFSRKRLRKKIFKTSDFLNMFTWAGFMFCVLISSMMGPNFSSSGGFLERP